MTIFFFISWLAQAGPSLTQAIHTKDIALARTAIFALKENVNGESGDQAPPLHLCARTNAKDFAALLIKQGADVNLRDADGRTALMIAASFRAKPMVEVLLSAGAQLAYEDARGWSAIDYAYRNGKKGLVKFLLRTRPRPYFTHTRYCSLSEDERYEQRASLFKEALDDDDPFLVELLFASGILSTETKFSFHRSHLQHPVRSVPLLFLAADGAAPRVFRTLLEKGCDPRQLYRGKDVVVWTVEGYTSPTPALLEFIASHPQLAGHRGLAAAEKTNPSLAFIFKDEIDPDRGLRLAMEAYKLNYVRYFQQRGADPGEGLKQALLLRNPDFIDLFLGQKVDPRLHVYAAFVKGDDQKILPLLAQKKVDLLEVLNIAWTLGDLEIVQKMLRYGVAPEQGWILAQRLGDARLTHEYARRLEYQREIAQGRDPGDVILRLF